MKGSITERLRIIFTEGDMKRIVVRPGLTGRILMLVDVHGMKRTEAKRFLSNLINLVNDDFDLDVIHGFNHGTVLRDMLQEDFHNSHICGKQIDIWNPGVTHIRLAPQ